MHKERTDKFRKILLEERNSILETIDLMDKNSGDRQEFSTELSLYDNHPADIGTEVFIAGHNANLRGNEEVLLSKVENALSKVKSGEYGKCEECGKEIDEERLEIIPYASMCIKCENEDKENDTFRDKLGYRPIEEENLRYPYGRTFKDSSKNEEVIFDGEDSWQAVDRFNRVAGDPSYGTGDQLGILDEDEDVGAVEEVEKISEDYYRQQL